MGKTTPQRGISAEFERQLKRGGILWPLLQRVQVDDTLSLEIRNGYVDIYYRGGRLLGLHEQGRGARFRTEFDWRYCDVDPEYCPVIPEKRPPHVIEHSREAQDWVDAFAFYKQIMDLRFWEHPKIEREYQQAVVRDNNRHATGERSDYVIVDVEYVQAAGAVPGQKTGYRFDMVGFRWPVAGGSRASSAVKPVIIEMKAGDGAITSSRKSDDPDDLSPGLVKHVLDFERFLTPAQGETISRPFDLLRAELVASFETKKRLELPSLPKNILKQTISKDDVGERPEVLFVLANHQPKTWKLRNELERLAERVPELGAHADYGVAAVSWAGYALFARNVIALDKFTSRLAELGEERA